jgi:hypothetical protein
MPVFKFRSIEEMKAVRLWTDANDPRLHERIDRHWKEWSAMVPFEIPRGLRKFHTIEEMNAERDAWETARIARIRERSKK